MSAQLGEFTGKAGAFKRQGRRGTRSHTVARFGLSLPHLIKCSHPQRLLGVQGKPLHSMEMKLFADTNDCHIQWVFPKENDGELSSCFPVSWKARQKMQLGFQEDIFTLESGGQRTVFEYASQGGP